MDLLIVYLITSVIFIVEGLVMLKVKQNYFIGVRTDITLSDPEIWDKTNKAAGILTAIIGAIMFVITLYCYLVDWKKLELIPGIF